MNSRHSGAIVSHGSSALATDDVEAARDGELLARFLGSGPGRAEAAFEALVRRHGPMVLGVCRHVLGEPQDAEDAFQATFLLLVRKAGTIRDPDVLGRWLYEVAFRTAVRAKANATRRNARERQGAAMLATSHDPDSAWDELKPVLHEEIGRLPDKYRTPVVLCYLEGKTNEEVAALLEWPVGTVKGRLSRARDLLRSRLTRRGLALSAGLLASLFSQNAVLAEFVPPRLVDSTVAAAMRVASGEPGGLSSRVAELLEPAPRPWPLLPLVALAAILLALTGIAAGASLAGGGLDGLIPGLGLGEGLFWLAPEEAAAGACHPLPAPEASSS